MLFSDKNHENSAAKYSGGATFKVNFGLRYTLERATRAKAPYKMLMKFAPGQWSDFTRELQEFFRMGDHRRVFIKRRLLIVDFLRP